jgi:protein-disulfide isomerase-like protein with CxxC motif
MVNVAYHTDPVCPWSWAFEPTVRKLMVDFGDGLDWTFVMGGLGRSLAREPAACAGMIEQWLRVSAETQAPLDPLLWAESPILSTYPACMAVKAAAEQADDRGYRYLRRLRESLMCDRRKLDQAEALIEESRAAGLDVERFRIDLRSNAITEAFAADLESTKELAARVEGPVRGASQGAGGAPLPTLVFRGDSGVERFVVGHQAPDVTHVAAVECGAKPVGSAPLGVEEAVARFGRVTTREVEVLCGLPGPRASAELFRLAEQWRLRPLRRLTGYLWEAAEGH